ncbi:MAG TPA: 4Fe-4S binding protein [Gaiellaceae bacterium]|nr:4Fe-4S binding protein [Gaiellaceae bacterium]
MSSAAVLVCGRTGLAADPPPGAILVDDLCDRPAAAAEALRRSGATRAVLGLCERGPSSDLLAALRRAGSEPFGVEAVALDGRPPAEAATLLAAAAAKLAALRAGERGRPALNGGAFSRRTLLSPGGAVTQAPVAILDEGACLGSARCGLCLARCPAKAIAPGRTAPAVDASACTACGLCVPVCPTGALRIAGASLAQVEAQLERLASGFDGVVLACAAAGADAPPGRALVELPTLAIVTLGWLLQLRARGLAVTFAPCDGPCCAGVPALEELAARLDAPAPRTEPLRLAEPAATIAALRVPGSAAGIASEAAPLGLVRLDDERCSLCGACAVACPTAAFRLEETPGETVLHFSADACTGCGRCAAACPEDALSVERGLDLARLGRGPVALARDRRERCSGCGADLPPRQMRRRLRELLPEYAAAPIELCAGCAARSTI